MYAINDALAHAIIHSTLDPDHAARGRFQLTLHPNVRSAHIAPRVDLRSPLVAARRLIATITAAFTPAPAQPACCAAA